MPGFVCFGFETGLRRSVRRDTVRSLVLVRNYPTDGGMVFLRGFSSSFKKSFLYRAVTKFIFFKTTIDMDSYYFQQLRKVLSLFRYDSDGIVSV